MVNISSQIAAGSDAVQVSGPPNSAQLCNSHIANSLHTFVVAIKEVWTYNIYLLLHTMINFCQSYSDEN